MTICIPVAPGVPGHYNEPPIWLDGLVLSKNTSLDDPRWTGSTSQGFGVGTSEEAQFRALYYTDGTGKKSLYLSFRVEYDAALNAIGGGVDTLYVALQPSGSGDPLILQIVVYNSSAADLTDAVPGSVQAYIQTGGGASTDPTLGATPLPSTPTWVDENVRVWLTTAAPVTWAVQIRIPIVPTAGSVSADAGLNLTDAFKMWYAMHVVTPTRKDGGTVAGGIVVHKWPLTAPNITTGLSGDLFPTPAGYDQFHLRTGAGDPMCSSTGAISLDLLSVGIKSGASYPGSTIKYSTSFPHPQNTFVARPQNGMATAIPANGITARFRLANWGSMVADPLAPWDDIPGGGAVTNPASIAPGLASEGALSFDYMVVDPELTQYVNGTKASDQCLLVELSGAGLTFTNNSVRRNMSFVSASRFSRKAEINIKGLTTSPPDGAATRAVYLAVESLNMPAKVIPREPDGKEKPSDSSIGEGQGFIEQAKNGLIPLSRIDQILPTYRVHVYHDTGDRLVVKGTTYALLAGQTSFGYYVEHEGALVGWEHSLTGLGLDSIATNFYKLEVPHDGTARVVTTIEALEPGDGDVLDRLLQLLDKLGVLLERLSTCSDRIDPLSALLRRLTQLIRLLPLPGSARAALTDALGRVTGIQQRMRALALLREALQGIEHSVEALDRIHDKLRAVDPQKRDAVIDKLFGTEAKRVQALIAAFEAEESSFAGLLHQLEGLFDELEELARLCHDVDGFYALLRGLSRSFDKLRVFGAGLEARFPLLDKLLPDADPSGGALGERLGAIAKNAEGLDAIIRILDALAAFEKDMAGARARLEAFEYEEIARVADRIYKEAIG